MASLAQQIAQLTNPAPVSHDPEDIDDVTTARIPAPLPTTDEVDKRATQSSTKIRRQAAALLVDDDSRYAGKKVSRQRLHNAGALSQHPAESDSDIGDSVVESEDGESVSEDSDQGSETGQQEQQPAEDGAQTPDDELAEFRRKLNVRSKGTVPQAEFSFEDDGDYDQYADSSGDEGGSEEGSSGDGDEDSESGDEEDSDDSSDRDEGGISQFSKAKGDEEVKKGEATKTQLTLWDQLLKARIELQKVLVLVNQLPQPAAWGLFTHAGGEPYTTALTEGQRAVKAVLDKVFYLQLRLILQHPETKHLEEDPKTGASHTPKKVNEEDEEIPSDSDEDGQEVAPKQNLKRKQKLQDYPDLLTKRHKSFTKYRNDTIQKWYDKTRVATGKVNRGFSAFEQSALKQIGQIMSDRERLVKRTQLKRTTYRVLGKTEACPQTDDDQDKDVEQPGVAAGRGKEYDEEVFDDDDFYHQLLRELIERRSLATNDPVALSRQWLELQKLRSKVKKKVDTRASKGRKIRYDILPKLVNFMAPSDTSSWTDEARDDLYSSLFGRRVAQVDSG